MRQIDTIRNQVSHLICFQSAHIIASMDGKLYFKVLINMVVSAALINQYSIGL